VVHSKGSGTGETSYIRAERRWQPERPVSLRGRRRGRGALELVEQRLELQQPCASPRQFSHFSPAIWRESFVNYPLARFRL